MKTMMLYLLRHGESLANVEHLFAARKIDPPLSADGIRQILAQTEVLRDVDFDGFYTSPLLRARQSAHIVQRQLVSWHAVQVEDFPSILCEVPDSKRIDTPWRRKALT
jgi:broad specificity phosphatase PhoE